MEPTDNDIQPLTGVVHPLEPSPDPERVKVLREAAALITGERQIDYGPPAVNFQRIADLWTIQAQTVLKDGTKFDPTLVALMLTQLKMARAVQSPKHDTFVDAAGYIALAAELVQEKTP